MVQCTSGRMEVRAVSGRRPFGSNAPTLEITVQTLVCSARFDRAKSNVLCLSVSLAILFGPATSAFFKYFTELNDNPIKFSPASGV